MKKYETFSYNNIFKALPANGNYVVRYSSHEWSGTWYDICIEQTLMKAAGHEFSL